MFNRRGTAGPIAKTSQILSLIYLNIARSVRKRHGNAFYALLIAMSQAVIMVMVFYVLFSVLGLRGSAIRGDFLLYIMTGVFMFFTHIGTVSAVSGADGPGSPALQHLSMNTAISITSEALATLYIQVISMVFVLYIYHAIWGPIEILNPLGALSMLLLSWFSGVAVGVILLAIKPWAPRFVALFKTLYVRANMIASGKMFVANTLPGWMVSMFDWNPLFHTIDQTRGFVFINYFPHNSNITYPLYLSLALLMIGLMAEFYTRKHVSLSWDARR